MSYVLIIIGLILSVAVCREGEQEGESDKITQKELDRLRSLPYASFSKDKADKDRMGVVKLDERSFPGYNLYVSRNLCLAELMDAEGRVINAWSHPDSEFWQDFELLPDGDLLVVENTKISALGKGRVVLRLTWDGETKWKNMMPADHEIHFTPGMPLLTFQFHYRSIPEIDSFMPVLDNVITSLSLEGDVLESYALYDILKSNPSLFQFQQVAPNKDAENPYIDLLHSNTVEWIHVPLLEAEHPIYSPGNILVTIRHQDSIAVINWQDKKLIWVWGQGIITGPHDATMLSNGNILLFDNGLNRGWSRVIELDPLSEKIVWEYKAKDPTDFYTATRGTNQRLPNQNTLITNSDSGQVFEVTPGGEIVWEFYSPHLNEKRQRAKIIRMKRYEESFIQKILESHPPPRIRSSRSLFDVS